MRILDYQKPFWRIRIVYFFRKTHIYYNPDNKEIFYFNSNSFTEFLKSREVQLLRILNNKSWRSFYRNFTLTFVLSKELIQPQYFNRDLITVLDQRYFKRRLYTKPDVSPGITCEIYTDGSFNHENKTGAYAVIIRKPNCNTETLSYQDNDYSNNALELKAIIKAFEKVKKERKIIVTTDSQYVIRGICYWIQNWKRNNWRTASGRLVKNIEYWKKLDKLLKQKYIEFQWVRSHRNHPENNLCDFIARQKTKEKNTLKNDFYDN